MTWLPLRHWPGPPMPEGISRRGDSWPARYRNPETGRQHERSFDKQGDAVRRRRQQLDALDRGRWVDPEAGKMSFIRYFEAWERDQLWTDGTRKAMSLAARSTTFADVDLRLVRPSHVEAWVKSMTVATSARPRPLAPGTIKTRFVNVRSVFRAAVRDGMIATDPTAQVRLPRLRKREAASRARRAGPCPRLAVRRGRGRAAAPEHRRPSVAHDAEEGRGRGRAATRSAALLRLRADRLGLRRGRRPARSGPRKVDHDAHHVRPPVALGRGPGSGRVGPSHRGSRWVW